jgi:hypothetical protein
MSLSSEAVYVEDPALMQPIRERFSAAAATIERSLRSLHDAPENKRLREASGAANGIRKNFCKGC